MLRGAVKLVYFHISEFWCVCVCVCSKILWSSTSAIIVILFCIYVRFLPEESELIKQTTIFILTNNTADDYLFNLQHVNAAVLAYLKPVIVTFPPRPQLSRGLGSPCSWFPQISARFGFPYLTVPLPSRSPTVLLDQQNVRPIKELLQTLYRSLCGLVQDMGKSVLVGNISTWVHRMDSITQWHQQLDNIQINRVGLCGLVISS